MIEMLAQYPGPAALTFFVGLLCGAVGVVSALARRGMMVNEREARLNWELREAVREYVLADGSITDERMVRTVKELDDAHS